MNIKKVSAIVAALMLMSAAVAYAAGPPVAALPSKSYIKKQIEEGVISPGIYGKLSDGHLVCWKLDGTKWKQVACGLPVVIDTIDGGTADLVLTPIQVYGSQIINIGQGANNRNHTLPSPAKSMSFSGVVGEDQASNYFRFTTAATGTLCLNGTCGKDYVSIAAPTRGATVRCESVLMVYNAVQTYCWNCKSDIGSWVTN